MGKLIWQTRIPYEGLEGAIKFLSEDLDWNLTIRQVNDEWCLRSGDQLLFVSSTKEELEAFLWGMALSFAVLPSKIIEQIKGMISE